MPIYISVKVLKTRVSIEFFHLTNWWFLEKDMDAYSVKVINTDKVNFNTFEYLEKNELAVAASGRLVHETGAAVLETEELATHYMNAITARRFKDGDKNFEAEVVKISGSSTIFLETVKKDSVVVLNKLEKWNYPTVDSESKPDRGWIIHLDIQDHDNDFYLLKIGKTRFTVTQDKDLAKRYKQHQFVQKALEHLKNVKNIRAVAVES